MDCTSPGKHPKFKGWQNVAGTDEAFGRWREGDNLGVATGAGLVVLDWDGHPTVSSCPTLKATTPNDGEHWYFRSLRPIRNGVKVFDGILDIRGEGGFVVVPPSEHINGGTYRWLGDVDRIVDPPPWIQRLLVPQRSKTERQLASWPMDDPEKESFLYQELLAEVLDELNHAPSGERNVSLFRAACMITESICAGQLSRDRLNDVAQVGVAIGLSVSEVKRTMTSAVGTVAK